MTRHQLHNLRSGANLNKMTQWATFIAWGKKKNPHHKATASSQNDNASESIAAQHHSMQEIRGLNHRSIVSSFVDVPAYGGCFTKVQRWKAFCKRWLMSCCSNRMTNKKVTVIITGVTLDHSACNGYLKNTGEKTLNMMKQDFRRLVLTKGVSMSSKVGKQY